MQAIVLDSVDGRPCARLADLPTPRLPGPDWLLVRVALGGVCGSDLRRVGHRAVADPAAPDPVPGTAVVLGHEIVGTVVDGDPDLAGRRVLVTPLIGCTARGMPACAWCRRGWSGQCASFWPPSGPDAAGGFWSDHPGKGLGMTSGLGGGWAEYVAAHRSMVRALPDHLPWRTAVLAEPLSVAVGAVRRLRADRPAALVVVGAGTLGLLTAWAASALLTGTPVMLLSRHAFQSEQAAHLCPTADLSTVTDVDAAVRRVGAWCGATPVDMAGGPMLHDGPTVIDAVGTPAALDLALRLAGCGRTVLTAGNPDACTDLRPLWLKRLTLTGHLEQVAEPDPVRAGEQVDSADEAIRLLARVPEVGDALVTHGYPLSDHATALSAAAHHDRYGSVKVVVHP